MPGGNRISGVMASDLARLFTQGTLAGRSDSELLDLFLTRRDEVAFEAIVARHGPMVLGVCRGILHDPGDVEDAFQAAFLILIRHARSVRRRDSLGGWLYRVTSHVAQRARTAAMRRRSRETSEATSAVEAASPQAGPAEDASRHETRALVYEEIERLPAKYRDPIVLCVFEGLSHDEAAQRLRWPVGTVKGRLARAKETLRERLIRRGVSQPVALVAADVGARSFFFTTAVPEPLVKSTVLAASAFAFGSVKTALTAGAVSAGVATLTQGALNAMLLTKIKTLSAVGVLALGLTATGAGVIAHAGRGDGSDENMEDPVDANVIVAVADPQGQDHEDDEALNDLEKLQGRWYRVSSESGGKKQSFEQPDQAPWFRFILEVKGNAFYFGVREDGPRPDPEFVTLSPSRTPKEIEIFPTAEPARGKILRGIYRIEGDTFTLCFAASRAHERPSEFSTRPGDGRILDVYQREKPLEHGEFDDFDTVESDSDEAREQEQEQVAERLIEAQLDEEILEKEIEIVKRELDSLSQIIAKMDVELARPGGPHRLGPGFFGPAETKEEYENQLKEVREHHQALKSYYVRKTRELERLRARMSELREQARQTPGTVGERKPRIIQAGDRIFIEVLQALPGRPLKGERLVRLDGTISLGFYGDLEVAGLTRTEIKVKLIEHLSQYIEKGFLGLVREDPETGELIQVDPADSRLVYVDDSPTTEAEARADRLDALERKLDEVLRRLTAPADGRSGSR